MDKISALKLLKQMTTANCFGCWVSSTKARSLRMRITGETITYNELVLLSYDEVPEFISHRPYRLCENSWCYNPEHLIFDEMKRFYLYSEKDKITECWNWKHAHDGGGYGCFLGKKYGREKAHRISYMENIGEIPKNMYVLHKCDNPACINPDHLFLGTHQENMTDKVNKNRQSKLNGNDNGRAVLNIDDVLNMRNDYSSGKFSYRDLVIKYGISQTQVARIIKNESWSWA